MTGIHRRTDMPNPEHFDILKQGTVTWNTWRQQHPEIRPDLSFADLSGATLSRADLFRATLSRAILSGADLSGATLSRADLSRATLIQANLSGVDLRGATLHYANLSRANLSLANLSNATLHYANLSGANLIQTILSEADLSGADLSKANLSRTILVKTNCTKATLTDCRIYGIAAWDVELQEAEQNSLVITDYNQPTITVDNLKIAQFIYLLLNNQEIRHVINTITTKVVLLLGRFTSERKAVLDAIKDELRKQGYVPVLFDFNQPQSRDITETVTTLAHLARFIIADITDAKSIPQELAFIVPNLPSVPVQPLLVSSQQEYGMFEHFTKFPWVLPIHRYSDLASLLASFKDQIIEPAEEKAKALEKH